MSIENRPKLEFEPEHFEATSDVEKNEKEILSIDAIKDIIKSQIGNKAEINKLELVPIDEGVALNAEIDAGMLGGMISLEGQIVNTENEITISVLQINARGYVKSRIESSLSNLMPAVKKYFEKQYSKPVLSIQISDSNLIIELGSVPDNQSHGNESKSQLKSLIEIINAIKDPWERIANIETYCRQYIELKKFNEARQIAELISNEHSRNATLKNIEKIENES